MTATEAAATVCGSRDWQRCPPHCICSRAVLIFRLTLCAINSSTAQRTVHKSPVAAV